VRDDDGQADGDCGNDNVVIVPNCPVNVNTLEGVAVGVAVGIAVGVEVAVADGMGVAVAVADDFGVGVGDAGI
jgi:hypothetical protein